MSSVAATTFHRFSQLPAEIQMITWGHALTPGKETSAPLEVALLEEMKYMYDQDPLMRCSYLSFLRVGKWMIPDLGVEASILWEARRRLSKVCRTSRLMALEAWKRDIALICYPQVASLVGLEKLIKGLRAALRR